MKIKRSFSFLTMLCIVLNLCIFNVHAVDEPEIESKAAILINSEDGAVYYSFNADTPLPPASLTRVMTVLLAFEAVERGELTLSEVVTASENCYDGITSDASTENIMPGEEMTLESLIFCAIVGGSNEACNIIAERVSGSISEFIELMNSRAAELRCKNTHFTNPHGLHSDSNYSSARDLAIITSKAIKYTKFTEIANTVSAEIPATNMHEARYLKTSNSLINPDRSRYYYNEASGIKNGNTYESGGCLISSASIDGTRVISVVLGCIEVQQDDGSFDIKCFSQTKKLLKWFLDNYSKRDIISTKDLICEVPVELGEGMNFVVVRPAYNVSVIMPDDYDISLIKKNYIIFSELSDAEPVTAPLSAGDVLGEMTYVYNGITSDPIPLVANTAVALSKTAYLQSEIKSILNKAWVKWLFISFFIILILYFIFIIRYNIVRSKHRRAAREAAKRKNNH